MNRREWLKRFGTAGALFLASPTLMNCQKREIQKETAKQIAQSNRNCGKCESRFYKDYEPRRRRETRDRIIKFQKRIQRQKPIYQTEFQQRGRYARFDA